MLKERQVAVTLGTYGVLSFCSLGSQEAFILLCVTNRTEAGFGFGSDDVGYLFAISGAFVLVLQMAIVPKLQRAWGARDCLLRACLSSSMCVLLSPLVGTALNAGSHAIQTVALVVSYSCLGLCTQLAFTSSFLLLNNSVVKKQRARVNGLGMAFGSLFKSCGPLICDSIFALSLQLSLSPTFVFFVISALYLLLACIVLRLPLSLNKPMDESLRYLEVFELDDDDQTITELELNATKR
jgi:hypothetical protein